MVEQDIQDKPFFHPVHPACAVLIKSLCEFTVTIRVKFLPVNA